MLKYFATMAMVAVVSLGLANPGSSDVETNPAERSSPQVVGTMTEVASTTASRSFACFLMRMCR